LTVTEKDVEFVKGYDKVFPPGPGREVLERVCMSCHGTTFISVKQWDRAAWGAAIDMMSRRVDGMDTSVPNGKLPPKDRLLLFDYLTAHFVPNAKKRVVAMDEDMPLDEEALSKAMYVEYQMPVVGTNGRPVGQNSYFDNSGNVWTADRGQPNAI